MRSVADDESEADSSLSKNSVVPDLAIVPRLASRSLRVMPERETKQHSEQNTDYSILIHLVPQVLLFIDTAFDYNIFEAIAKSEV